MGKAERNVARWISSISLVFRERAIGRGLLARGAILATFAVSGAVIAQAARAAEGETDREAKLLFNTASRLYRQENWSEAAASFGRFLAEAPQHDDAPEARFARGYCFYQLGRYREAADDLREANRSPGKSWSPDAAEYLGRALESLAGRASANDRPALYREAAESYGRAAKLHKEGERKKEGAGKADGTRRWLTALESQGEALFRAGDYEAAARVLAELRGPASREQPIESRARGLYFLALSHYARERGSAESRFPRTLEALAEVTGVGFEEQPFWEEAAFLEARVRHAIRDGSADGLYGRVAARGGAHAAEASFYRALARYEAGRPEDLESAARFFADFGRTFGDSPLAETAAVYEAFALFRLESYSDTAARLERALPSAKNLSADIRTTAWMTLGQALLLAATPNPKRAGEALERALRSAEERGASGERDRFQVLYWSGEARLALGDAGSARSAADLFATAAESGKIERALDERCRYKRAEALFRAGDYEGCAAAAKSYREHYPEGAFVAASLELSARNAFTAPPGSLDDSERLRSSEYFAAAALASDDPAEKRALRFQSGAAAFYAGDWKSAEALFRDFSGALSPVERDDLRYVELPFFLAECIVETELEKSGALLEAREGTAVAKDPKRLEEAAALFGSFVLRARRAKTKIDALRHLPSALLHRAECLREIGAISDARDTLREFLLDCRDHPLASEARFLLAETERDLGDADAAVATFEASAKDESIAPRALLEAGLVERSRKRYGAAASYFESAARIEPNDAATRAIVEEAAYLRGMTFLAAGEKDRAREALRELLERHRHSGRSADARVELARLELERDPEAALSVLEPLLGLEGAKRRDEALYLSAWAHRTLGDRALETATSRSERRATDDSYHRLIDSYPSSPFARDARFELGEDLARRGDRAAARAELDELVKLLSEGVESTRPGGPEERILARALYALGTVDYEAGDLARAQESFDRTAELENSVPESALLVPALFHSARAAMKTGSERDAAVRFERLTGELGEKSGNYYEESLLRLGECYHRLEEYPKAVACFERLLAERPEGELKDDARFGLGFAYQYMDRPKDAIVELRKVVEGTTAVVAARAQYHIGECFMDEGLYREAAREFLGVVAGFDFEGAYRDWYRRALLSAGLAYEAAGDLAAARAQWQELARGYPDSDEGKAAAARLREVTR